MPSRLEVAMQSLDFGMKTLSYVSPDTDPDMVVLVNNSTEYEFHLYPSTSKPVHGAWIKTPDWKIGCHTDVGSQIEASMHDSPMSRMTLEGKGRKIETTIVYKFYEVIDHFPVAQLLVFYISTQDSTFHAGVGVYREKRWKDLVLGKGEDIIQHIKDEDHSKHCLSQGEYLELDVGRQVPFFIQFQPNDVSPFKVLFNIEPKKDWSYSYVIEE